MSDKINRKEEAAGLQYIKKFLIRMAASDFDANWQPKAEEISKTIHRTIDTAPILGEGMTDILFYQATLKAPGYRNNLVDKTITFQIGKYLGKIMVAYYHNFSNSKWYQIDDTPDKTIVKRITESHGWEGKDPNPVPPITKMEEAEALQFIRNVAIPYSIDHIYNLFLARFPNANPENFPRVGYDALRKNLKKWQQNGPESIVYLTEFGRPRAYFKYYIQKISGNFGVRVMIHNQLPISHSHKTNDVVLYIGKGKQPSWFQKLGYIKEAHNPQLNTIDINREEEQDAERTIVQYIIPDALHWYHRSSVFGKKPRPITQDEVKRGMRKVTRDRDFILYKFQVDDDEIWFGISKKVYDNHILSIGYHVGKITQVTTGYGEKGFEYDEDFKDGWIWRQYQPKERKWDVYLNETMMGPDDMCDVNKREEAQAIQWIRDHIFAHVAKEIGSTEEQLRSTFKKVGHNNQIWYTSQTGLPNFPDVAYAIFRNDQGQVVASVDNEPGWRVEFPVGDRRYLADFGKMTENQLPPGDPRFNLSKIEEARALQAIRNLIPQVTKNLNAYIASGASGIKFRHERLTTEKSIADNLKKTTHRKQSFSSRRGPQDYIEYASREIGRPEVVFFIYKTDINPVNHHPQHIIRVVVGYHDFDKNSVGSTTKHLTENDPPHPGESEESYVNRVVKISKREEAEGLWYIQRFMIDKASKYWNGIMAAGSRPELYISPEDILKNFKKTERRLIPADRLMERHAHEKVTYTSHIPHVYDVTYTGLPVDQYKKHFTKGVTFTFYSSKNGDGTMIVSFVPPGRKDAGMCYRFDELRNEPKKLKEWTELTIQRISKKEELEALQYIRRVLGPAAVRAWNNRTLQHQLNPDEVLGKLKKINDDRPSSELNLATTNTDRIVYSVELPVRDLTLNHKVFFTFVITKNSSEKITIYYTTPLVDGGPYVVGASPFTGLVPPIKENYEANPNPHKGISKMDELKAVDFIKKLIIPMAIKRYNTNYKPHGEVTADEVRKEMKKKSHEKWPRITSDFVVYESPTKVNGRNFHWEIWKESTGKLKVGWKFDNEINLWNTYFVDDPSPTNESISLDTLTKTYKVTKKEEDYAADFIKKRMVPGFVKFVNDTNHHYTRHRQITIEEVLKTFKKISEWGSNGISRREIQYQALFLGEPFVFDIFKDSSGKLKVLQMSDGTQHFVKYYAEPNH